MKRILTICLLVCLLCIMLLPMEGFAEKHSYTWTETDENGNEHIYTFEYDSDDLLSKNEVWVMIHPDWHDREYTPEDFSEVNCVAIEELVIDSPDYYERYFLLTLADEGIEYVYRAIEILGAREDILEAHPNALFVPQTGETALLPVATTMLLLSGTALAGLLLRKRKYR